MIPMKFLIQMRHLQQPSLHFCVAKVLVQPPAPIRVCLVEWMKRNEEGWDEVILFFIVFGWESAVSVRDERQKK
jgi:hypothetical protein